MPFYLHLTALLSIYVPYPQSPQRPPLREMEILVPSQLHVPNLTQRFWTEGRE